MYWIGSANSSSVGRNMRACGSALARNHRLSATELLRASLGVFFSRRDVVALAFSSSSSLSSLLLSSSLLLPTKDLAMLLLTLLLSSSLAEGWRNWRSSRFFVAFAVVGCVFAFVVDVVVSETVRVDSSIRWRQL